MIDKFLNDKNYFKEYIDIAFFGILAIAVLNPIIEYTQSIFIPNNATEFSWGNILLFFLSILPFIVLPLFTNHIMHKINYSKSIQNKKLLFKLIEKLSDYNFDYNELNRYINFKILFCKEDIKIPLITDFFSHHIPEFHSLWRI